MTESTTFNFIDSARRTVKLEQEAVGLLSNHLDENFTRACQLIIQCRGRVVVTGMGKSGHVGNKMAATLASTGTPAFFVHPGEASHGDMGMITAADVVIALSNSGETSEVTSLLPLLKRQGTQLISMTGNKESTLAKAADTVPSGLVSQMDQARIRKRELQPRGVDRGHGRVRQRSAVPPEDNR